MAKDKISAVDMIMAEAKREVNKEARAKYVGQVKAKMTNLHQAKLIVKNIEREIEDLEVMINEELS